MTEPGYPLTEIELPFQSNWCESGFAQFAAVGTLPLYLEYFGKGKVDLLNLRIESKNET